MKRDTTPPALLLSTESLLGVSRTPRGRALDTLRRYEDPKTLAVAFSKAMKSGADGVLVSPSQVVRDALDELDERVPLYALLPNVPQYVRDSSDAGLVGAALKRVRRASPWALVRLGLTGLTHAPRVLRSDFAGMVPLLLELEGAALGPGDLQGVVLAAALTDLALAGGHRAFFEHLVRFMRGRFRARAGFETHNLGHLLTRLHEWGVEPDLVVGPVNPCGLLMKPSAAEVLAALAASSVAVVAKEVTAGGTVALPDGWRYARARGARGVAVDVADLEDVGAGLRALNV
jgi:hypothetical protein